MSAASAPPAGRAAACRRDVVRQQKEIRRSPSSEPPQNPNTTQNKPRKTPRNLREHSAKCINPPKLGGEKEEGIWRGWRLFLLLEYWQGGGGGERPKGVMTRTKRCMPYCRSCRRRFLSLCSTAYGMPCLLISPSAYQIGL